MSLPGVTPFDISSLAKGQLPRVDPFTGYNFIVIISDIPVAGFSDVSGIASETEVEEYKEGGENQYVHKLPTITKYGNLILKNGMTNLPLLYNWYKDVVQGKINRKEITIILLDPKQLGFKTWTYRDAYPVKWSGPELNANNNAVAIESLEIAHAGPVW